MLAALIIAISTIAGLVAILYLQSQTLKDTQTKLLASSQVYEASKHAVVDRDLIIEKLRDENNRVQRALTESISQRDALLKKVEDSNAATALLRDNFRRR